LTICIPLVFLRVPINLIVRKELLFIVCVCVGHVHAQPKSNSKSLPLLTVHSNQLTTDEFVYLYRKNHPRTDDYTDKKVNEYLDLLVNFKLKVVEASARGLDTTSAFKREFKTYRKELKKPYLASPDLLDSLTREAYRRMNLEIKASHILITLGMDASPADTMAAFNKVVSLRKRIMEGEEFGKLAEEASEDPGAKTNHGNLGYFTGLQMVFPFEEAAYRLKTGEISDPVRTRFGYHLIKITDRRLARGEVEASHIILRAGAGDDKKVRSKIFEIYDQLQSGRAWDELCKEFSDDQATRNSGGRLRPFGVGALPGVPEFEAMAFSLPEPGEISDPFQSVYGWHIVRLERRIPISPYEEMEAALKKRVSRDERIQVAEQKMLEVKKKTFDFSEEAETKNQLFALGDSTVLQGTWKYSGPPALRSQPLCRVRGGKIQASEFISYVEGEQAAGITPAVSLSAWYERFVRDRLEALEENALLASNTEYRNLVHEYKEGILLFTVMEQEVWNKASEDSTGLRQYYDENKEKYKADERVHALVFATPDSILLERFRAKVLAGDSIRKEDLKKLRSVVPPRNYARSDSKAVDAIPWAIGLHVTQQEGTYYMVQIDNLVPPGIKTLEEARALVISDYQDFLEKNWVAMLKAKYPVRINNRGRKSVLRELINRK